MNKQKNGYSSSHRRLFVKAIDLAEYVKKPHQLTAEELRVFLG